MRQNLSKMMFRGIKVKSLLTGLVMASRNQDIVEEDLVFQGVPILLTATSRLGEMTPQVRILQALPRFLHSGCILEAAHCLDQVYPSKWPILATKSLESQELYEIVNGENHRQFFLDAPEKIIGRSARIILVETINLTLLKQQLITSGRPVALGGMRHGLGRLLIG